MVRDAVAFGIPPEDALVCATLNPALWHGLSHLGAVAPGYQADLLVLPDLERFVPERRAQGGEAGRRDPARRRARLGASHGAHRRARAARMFRIPWRAGAARVIGLVPGPDRDGVARRGADRRAPAKRSRTPPATSRRSP